MNITYDIKKCEIYGNELSNSDMKRFKIRWILKGFKRIKGTNTTFDKGNRSFTISTIKTQFTFVYDTLKYSIEESQRLGAVRKVEMQELNTEGLMQEHKDIVNTKLREAKNIRQNIRNYLRGGIPK